MKSKGEAWVKFSAMTTPQLRHIAGRSGRDHDEELARAMLRSRHNSNMIECGMHSVFHDLAHCQCAACCALRVPRKKPRKGK